MQIFRYLGRGGSLRASILLHWGTTSEGDYHNQNRVNMLLESKIRDKNGLIQQSHHGQIICGIGLVWINHFWAAPSADWQHKHDNCQSHLKSLKWTIFNPNHIQNTCWKSMNDSECFLKETILIQKLMTGETLSPPTLKPKVLNCFHIFCELFLYLHCFQTTPILENTLLVPL